MTWYYWLLGWMIITGCIYRKGWLLTAKAEHTSPYSKAEPIFERAQCYYGIGMLCSIPMLLSPMWGW